MNTAIEIIDFVVALWYSGLAYATGKAFQYGLDPRAAAAQQRANLQARNGSFLFISMALASAAALVPIATLLIPFWQGPWWAYVSVAVTVGLCIALPFMRVRSRHLVAQRYRLMP